MREIALKDIYEAILSPNIDMVVGNRTFHSGETLLYFDDIQQLNLAEVVSNSSANGGYNNKSFVDWDSTKQMDGVLIKGTASKFETAIFNQTTLKPLQESIILPRKEFLLLDKNKTATLKSIPILGREIKVGLLEEGEVISEILDYELVENTIKIDSLNPYSDIQISYWFSYENPTETISIGEKDLNGYFTFVGKFHYKKDDGEQNTGVIRIPQVKIVSDFRITLGRSTNPLISNLYFKAIPIGSRHQEKVLDIIYLDEDIS